MSTHPLCHFIYVPREAVGDDEVRLVQWLVEEGARVLPGDIVAIVETSKATFDIFAEAEGYLYYLECTGAHIAVGDAIAVLSERLERPENLIKQKRLDLSEADSGGPIVSRKAQRLLQEHNLSVKLFSHLSVVRASDVESLVVDRDHVLTTGNLQRIVDEDRKLRTEWDHIYETQEYKQIRALLEQLRRRMKGKYDRHVPTGDLLYDRWEMANDLGFGEHSSIYEACLVLGDVSVGKHCWIGLNVILDGGNAPLIIGDYTSIGSGAHIYTHNTIERVLTGHKAPLVGRGTTIGSCCFVSPLAIIGPGTQLGDHCFVAAGSYVQGIFPSHSYIAGNPARRIGEVVIKDDRAKLIRFDQQAGSE